MISLGNRVVGTIPEVEGTSQSKDPHDIQCCPYMKGLDTYVFSETATWRWRQTSGGCFYKAKNECPRLPATLQKVERAWN